MKLPRTEWQSRKGLRHLLDTLGATDGETRYVGGCVRDTLLGIPVNDVDLATRLTPQAVLDRLKAAKIKAVPTGLAHGTITAVVEGKPIEVTTLRRDVSTDGRRATIAYTGDWREDAARRDFTINALSADPLTLEVFDYFGGWEDVGRRRVRFIGDPLIRIAEDHLRILRFFRFHARFGEGVADAAALDACTARANDLMALSRERIADELLKLLGLADPSATVRLMVERGILAPVLPEVDAAGVAALERLVPREKAAGVAPDGLRRLAALLPRDVGIAASVAARLRLSRKAAKRLASAADPTVAGEPRRLAYRVGAEEAVDRLLLGGAEPGAAASLAGWQRPRLGIKGGDLIALGLSAGPLVAATLQRVEAVWADQDFPEAPEAQRAIARREVDQALRERQ